MIGDDKPFSLFLAAGIPFEVTDEPATDGWTFLSDFDKKDFVSGTLKSRGTIFVTGSNGDKKDDKLRCVPENLKEILAFKHEIIPQLKNIPYVEEDKPVVCVWYPQIRSVLLWNLSETKESFTLKFDNKIQFVEIDGLDSDLVRI